MILEGLLGDIRPCSIYIRIQLAYVDLNNDNQWGKYTMTCPYGTQDTEAEIIIEGLNLMQTTIQNSVGNLDGLQERYADDPTVQQDLAILNNHKLKLVSALELIQSTSGDVQRQQQSSSPSDISLPTLSAPD